MKILSWRRMLVALLLSVCTLSGGAYADCGRALTPAASSAAVQEHRTEVFELGKREGLPMFSIALNGDEVPVVLLNRKTIQAWTPLLEHTFGIVQALEPGNDADHGNIRLPGKVDFEASFSAPGALYEGGAPTAAMMDLFSPGLAGPNAMNGNGYRFKNMAGYFQRRNARSTVFVDLSYTLPTEDQARVWLYHAAKRIALVRIQYAFDEANNYWINQQRRVLQKDGDSFWNKCTGGFEQCNNSRLGANAGTHTAEMRGRMRGLFNQDVNAIYALPETKRLLDEAKKDLLFRDWRDAGQYDPNFLDQSHYLELMQSHFNPDLSHEQKVDALSYLLATNVFEEVMGIRDRLGIAEGRQSQYGNPNITAVLIYSDAPGSVQGFYSGQFEYFGARSGNGFSHHYFQTHTVYPAGQWPQNWSQYAP